MTNEEIIAIVNEIIEIESISKKQHQQILTKCNLLHTKKK